MPSKKPKSQKKKQSELNGSHKYGIFTSLRMFSHCLQPCTARPKLVEDGVQGAEDEAVKTPTATPDTSKDEMPGVEAEVDSAPEAERIKELGNEAFKGKRYDEAIAFYSRAIGAITLIHILSKR